MILPRQLIKLAFHLLYHQMAWTYDWVAWGVSFGQWAWWRRMALGFMEPGPTLELAYGTGGFFVDMLKRGYRPVGIDRSPYMARIAGKRLRHHLYPIRITQSEAQHLPFPSEHFTNVVATFPSNYMLEPNTLDEVYRVLKQGGHVVVVFEGQLRGFWPLRPLVEWLYEITDQRSLPPSAPVEVMQQHQFDARWEVVERDGGAAHVIVAHKP